MKYKKLKSIYYEDKNKYKEKYELRINGDETVLLPLDVNDKRAFYVHNSQVAVMLDRISMLSRDINEIVWKLPRIAVNFLKESFLIDEIMTTYTMEGVHSSRREVFEALKTEDKSVRFFNLAKKYSKMLENMELDLKEPKKLRELYDEIIIDEIEEKNYPDGKFFRNGKVFVQGKTADGKVKHEGVRPPEDNIILALEKALSVMNMDDMPSLVKIAILHYYLGYIHPFYDGNGRMDRYISSCLIARYVNPLMAIRISNTIKAQKNRYDKLFDECNSKINCGDLTPFVIGFVDMVQDTAKNILENLTNLESSLSMVQIKTLSNEEFVKKYDMKEIDKVLFYVLIQNDLFSENGLTKAEIVGILNGNGNYNKSAVERSLKKLLNTDLPIACERVSRHKVYNLVTSKLN